MITWYALGRSSEHVRIFGYSEIASIASAGPELTQRLAMEPE